MNEKNIVMFLLAVIALIIVIAVVAFGYFIYGAPYYPIEDEPGVFYWDRSNPATPTLLPLYTQAPATLLKLSGDPYPPPETAQPPIPYPPPEQPTPAPTPDECPGGTIVFNDEGDAACYYQFTPTP